MVQTQGLPRKDISSWCKKFAFDLDLNFTKAKTVRFLDKSLASPIHFHIFKMGILIISEKHVRIDELMIIDHFELFFDS